MNKRIGIVAQEAGDDFFGVHKDYLEFASRFGTPVMLAPSEAGDFPEIYKIDALLLPGGADVWYRRYTFLPHWFAGRPNLFLEQFDKDILPLLAGNLPIFGICRGLQTLNVHYGGTLYQHLYGHVYSQFKDDLVHYVWKPWGARKSKGEFKVNSFHHQGIHKLAKNFEPLLTNDQGTVEAILDEKNKIAAVQWHPERFDDQFSVKLFQKILA